MKTILAWSGGEVVACVHVKTSGVKSVVKRLCEEHGRVRVEVCSNTSMKEEIES